MKRETQLPATSESLPIALLRAREVLMGPIRRMLAASGLTEQQWRILRVIEEGGAMDAQAVARGAALAPPSLSRILPALEARGLVRRRSDPGDRRRQVVEITGDGAAVIASNHAQAQALAEAVRTRLGDERTRALLDILKEISSWQEVG